MIWLPTTADFRVLKARLGFPVCLALILSSFFYVPFSVVAAAGMHSCRYFISGSFTFFFFRPVFFVGFSEYSCSLCVRVFPRKFRLFVCRCLYVRMRLEVCVSVCFAYASVVVDSKRNLRVEPPRNDSDLGHASPALFRLRGC